MVLKVLGSASSQGIPHPLCTCVLCKNATGKDRRLRSSYIVELNSGPRILLDASPDFRQQQLKYQLDFDYLFLSHRHRDHTEGLREIRISLEAHDNHRPPSQKQRTFLLGKNLHRWLSKGPRDSRWEESTQQAYQQLLGRGFFRKILLTPFKEFKLNEVTVIIYLRGLHGDRYCGGLQIREDNRKLVYLADISDINGKLRLFLTRTPPDLLIAHAPFFNRPREQPERERHLGVEDLKDIPGKQILLSHFSHRVRWPHQQLIKRAQKLDPRFVVAYDGQVIRI